MTGERLRTIGSAQPRRDGIGKVTGNARFAADVELPGMLHAKVLRSPHAHARVVRIDTSKAARLAGVHHVATRDDFAGMQPVYGWLIKDQPVLAIDKVRYVGDMIAAVAADDEATAYRALDLIDVDYELLPDLQSIEAALEADAPALFEEPPIGFVNTYGQGASAEKDPRKNVCYRFNYRTGDASVFGGCDHIFEDTFTFSRMQHYFLEPYVAVAQWQGDQVEVWSATQSPFLNRKELARVFQHPEEKITVNVLYVGGGYGAKTGCKTEPIAVLLARITARPVRLAFTMEEQLLTNTQHAAVLKLRTGVMNDGTLVARQSEILLNAGAYSDASPLVAEKAGYRIPGSYRWRHIDTQVDCVLTNQAPAGAFRGFGGTQAAWASESQIDMIARRLGIDPYALRMKNLKDLGEAFVPGESAIDSDLRLGLDLICERLDYQNRPKRRGHGIGLSVVLKDGGGVNKAAHAMVKATTNGGIIVSSATVELGQGAHTALTSMAAEVLNCEAGRVTFAAISTGSTPWEQGTFASSGTTIMGRAVVAAAAQLKEKVLAFAAEDLGCSPDQLILEDWTVRKGNEVIPLAPMIMKNFGGPGFEFTGTGYYKPRVPDDHSAPLETPVDFWEIGWGGAEVEVDQQTGQVRVLKLVVSSDFGRIVHHGACRGQDEGSAMMGLGQALFETVLYDGGRPANGTPLSYRVPLSTDLPGEFISISQEQGHGRGPFGTKGGGEGGILPVASAIANAIDDAVGVRITDLPITPEKVLAALDKQK
jgi:CO/xanthine dehydrogenase Mo-binding subunit